MGRYLTPSSNIEQLQHNLIGQFVSGGLTVTDFCCALWARSLRTAVVLMATSQLMGLTIAYSLSLSRRALRAQLLAAQCAGVRQKIAGRPTR